MQTLNVNWSEPSTLAGTGVHHGYRTAPGSEEDIDWVHLDSEFSLPVGTIRKVWWGMLEPGGFILPHIDKGPYFVRWHYPIEPAGYVWQWGNEPELLFEPSEPFEIAHWESHAVWNPPDKRRVHLIVELDELVDGVDHNHDLKMFPVFPEMQPLVDAAMQGLVDAAT